MKAVNAIPHDNGTARGHRIAGGFTMVELLVTMLLLTIVLVGLAALQLTTIRQVTGSKYAGEAMRLAQMVTERYKSMPFASLPAAATPAPSPAWIAELMRDGSSAMTNVGVDGESDGPFTVQSLHERVGQAVLLTVKVTWTGLQRGIEADPTQQYREMSVQLTMQRFP